MSELNPPQTVASAKAPPIALMSTAQAKHNLLLWSVRADHAMMTKAHAALVGIRGRAKRAAPWFVGFAALAAGLALVLPAKPRDGVEHSSRHIGGGIFKVVATLAPTLMSLFTRR